MTASLAKPRIRPLLLLCLLGTGLARATGVDAAPPGVAIGYCTEDVKKVLGVEAQRKEETNIINTLNLRRIGYRGRISIEARTDDLDVDGPRAISFLRSAMASGVKPPARPASASPIPVSGS